MDIEELKQKMQISWVSITKEYQFLLFDKQIWIHRLTRIIKYNKFG